jgi:hypothetical protein
VGKCRWRKCDCCWRPRDHGSRRPVQFLCLREGDRPQTGKTWVEKDSMNPMTKNSKLSAPADSPALTAQSAEKWFMENRGERATWAETEIDVEKFRQIIGWMERYAEACAAPPSRGNEAPHNAVTARFGFGELDLSTLKEDEFVTASGLNDGGWVVCKRLPSTPEETGPPQSMIPDIVIHVIESFTGPTGGWLESPVVVCNEICKSLRGTAPSSVTPSIGCQCGDGGCIECWPSNFTKQALVEYVRSLRTARASSPSSATTATDPLKPSATLLIKLGSMVVHLEEILSPKRHEYDIAALNSLKEDEEVIEWFRAMNKTAFLPVRR